MSQRWYQLPTAVASSGGATILPFSCEGDVVVVYRDAHAYASFTDERDLATAARLPGVRMLTPREVAMLDRDVPAPYRAVTRHAGAELLGRRGRRAAGWLARLLGLDEDEGWGNPGGWLDSLPLRVLGRSGRREW
jgi:hypothetical protein